MKKIFLILTMAGVPITVPVIAAQKCIALDANLTVTSSYAESYETYWSATLSNGIKVEGDGICSDSVGGTAPVKQLDLSSPDIYRSHCWCRIFSPAVSYWVYTFWLEDADGGASDCRDECSEHCRYYFVNDTSYRVKMFSQLSD
ncbi:MAG: hypothetical protein E7009_03510 [Alphaproteobacteria bacterium]|nr:hypothetical protein [Alphaproteobacteria bacterium]